MAHAFCNNCTHTQSCVGNWLRDIICDGWTHPIDGCSISAKNKHTQNLNKKQNIHNINSEYLTANSQKKKEFTC